MQKDLHEVLGELMGRKCEVDDGNFQRKVEQSDKPVILIAYARNCRASIQALDAPLRQFAKKHIASGEVDGRVNFGLIRISETDDNKIFKKTLNPQSAAKLKVRIVPSVCLINRGNLINSQAMTGNEKSQIEALELIYQQALRLKKIATAPK